ncbi:MAG TPA: aminopeptidase P N-terminal domain-containing protein, partial [Candidatus Limnocylindrales bacterium]|nr:aminopeptidase P N-terminal domain-containing protein [Candidatus Limnocylindrales bacterium]
MSTLELEPFADRRRRVAEAVGDALAVIPGAREVRRNADTDYEFRQSSDFFFLTGFDEPDAVLVLNPAHAKERFVLFVRPRDREMEIWNGHRAGIEGAIATYGADAAYPVDQLDDKLREFAIDRPALFYRLGDPAFDGKIIRLLDHLRAVKGRGFTVPTRVEDPSPIIHELRLRQSPAELACQREACAISREAHKEAMRFARPGMHEYEVQAAMEFVFRAGGSPRNGYPSIVASGPNACILHYHENTRRMEDGDLLLIDAACEYGYHSADITRTFPVNGRFTPPQRAIYQVVLDAQLAAIAACRPGNRYADIHDAARTVLAEGLVRLGALPLGVRESLAMHHYREFYMHGTGHWLGMDVHDVGDYRRRGESRVLEPGMVLTVEPGLYFDPEREVVTYHRREYSEEELWERRYRLGTAAARKIEDEEKARAEKITHPVPAGYRGIGVRIEDDILITDDGCEVLTAGTPK